MTPFGLRKKLARALGIGPGERGPAERAAVEPPAARVPGAASPGEPVGGLSLEEPALEVDAPIPGALLLDIREPGEMGWGVAEGATPLPMDLVPHHLDELPRDRPIVVYCAAGARSFGVAHWLREQGFDQAWSLEGGLDALRRAGVRMVVPPGIRPGTRVRVAAGAGAGGATSGPTEGEVVRQDGDAVDVVARDAQGMAVRLRVAVERVVPV